MIEITYDRAVELAENAIADRGADHVYSNPLMVDGFLPDNVANCLYLHPDGPGCIVGHMLDQVGIDLEGTRLNKGGSISSIIRTNYISIRVTNKALAFLSQIQRDQDNGYSWGEALTQAKGLVGIRDDLDDTSWI